MLSCGPAKGVLGQNGIGQNGTEKMVGTKYTDKFSLIGASIAKAAQNGRLTDKMVYGQNGMGLYLQNGTGQNGKVGAFSVGVGTRGNEHTHLSPKLCFILHRFPQTLLISLLEYFIWILQE